MTNARKYQVLTALLLACLCTTTFAAEANPPKPELKGPELKFVISTKEVKWLRSDTSPGRGPIKPKYEALFHIRGHLSLRMNKYEMKELILKTTAGKSMSAGQKEFLAKSQDASRVKYGSPSNTYSLYRLYAVSQDDAKKMAAALIEALNDPQVRIRLYRNKLLSLREEFSRYWDRPASKAKIEIGLAKFREDKFKGKGIPYLTVEEAKRTISELNKMLNLLQIDKAGMLAKHQNAEMQRKKRELILKGEDKQADKIPVLSCENIRSTFFKLEEMMVDISIELAALESKIKTASRLREQAKDFYKKMSERQFKLEQELGHWKSSIKTIEGELRRIKKILANPKLEMPPVEINQNTVTIYPVESVQDSKKAKAKSK